MNKILLENSNIKNNFLLFFLNNMIQIQNYVSFIRNTHTSNVCFDQLDYLER